jgi:hypothetical protein
MSFRMALRTLHCRRAPVAQLDRAPGFEPGGREFESLRARHWFFCMRTVGRVKLSGVLIRTPRQTTSRFDNLAGFGQVGRCRVAAAVRSEAEDERRSREQSVRARHL